LEFYWDQFENFVNYEDQNAKFETL